jgi:hypothetical protein
MLVCPHCKRSNPAEAAFCHFDGVELRAGRDSNVQTDLWLPAPFVFPSGRRCRNLEQLALGCQEEWSIARVLLVQGVFAQFLQTCGRLDLTRAAHKAATQSDPDIALQTFLVGLPLPAEFRPRLELRPRRLLLGSLRVGERRTVQLLVVNAGRGLLHGSLTVHGGGSWLRLADGGERCSLKTTQQQAVALQLDTRGLAAGQTHGARLTIITNGGIVEVPVRLDLAAFGFPTAPFEGAASPRQLAERMRADPAAAVPLLENGVVAHWFGINGWVWPVNGPIAPGLAAVQQYFEALGLARPPHVQLEPAVLTFTCTWPEVAHGEAQLVAAVKKWVYARADSNVPWLRVTTPQISGPRRAVLALEVDTSLLEADRCHEGVIQVVANAGQRLRLRVRVEVRRPEEPFTRRLLRPFWLTTKSLAAREPCPNFGAEGVKFRLCQRGQSRRKKIRNQPVASAGFVC